MKLRLQNHFLFATFFIAGYALSTGATAQNVYRCGNSYSQTPCPDAVVVDVEDTRSTSQKKDSDTRVRHDAATADALEKKRLQEEAQALAGDNKPPAHAKKDTRTRNAPPPTSAADAPGSADKDNKKSGTKKKEPAFFTARVVTEKKTTKTSKTGNP